MIFDNAAATELVIEWQASKDGLLLEHIIDACIPLVESIASQFDSEYRDDLIQESVASVIYAIEFYDINIAKLYSYLSAVARNACIMYMRSATRDPLIPLDVNEIALSQHNVDGDDNSDIITGLVVHNRQRFPSLPVDDIDAATEYIYCSVRDGIWGKSRGIVSHLTNAGFPRNVATVLYHSSIVYLRSLYAESGASKYIDGEFTLLPELEMLVGAALHDRVMVIMSGMYIKIP